MKISHAFFRLRACYWHMTIMLFVRVGVWVGVGGTASPFGA